jgi:hypothetical protein
MHSTLQHRFRGGDAVNPKPGWFRGIAHRVDEQMTQPAGVGYGPPPDEIESLRQRITERTPDELERLALCEHHTEILATNAKIEWHASETARLVLERAERQQAVALIMARLGISVK